MTLTLTILILCFLPLLIIVYYILPIIWRHQQLLKDYRNISLLPLSPIPFVGNLHQFDKRQHVFFQLLCQLAKQCQDQGKGLFCLWLGPTPRIFLCSGQGLESFINNSKHLVKSWSYDFAKPWLKTGLLTSNNEKWRSRRRLITPSFHDTQLLHNFIQMFNEQSSIFARRLDEYAKDDNKTHDLYPYISACTLDIIAETATGTHPNAQLSDGENDFVEATARIKDIISLRIRCPWLWPKFIFDQLPIGKEQQKSLEILHRFSRKVIEERLATTNSRNTTEENEDKTSRHRLVFLDSLIAQMQAEKLSLDDIQEEVDTFIFEGHDTTAAAINFSCYLVGSHPNVQAKIHAEMDSIFDNDRERPCTIEDIEQMTYLDCVIKESLRLLPSVPVFSREVQEDFEYCGQTIRKGTNMGIFVYGIHHDANVFPNPEKFDPERFANQHLISDKRSPFAYIPFSAGSRNCIGQRFAGLEERVVLSTLFRRFSFQSTQTIEELNLLAELILRPSTPIEMIVKRR